MNRVLLIILACFTFLHTEAQSNDRDHIRLGNRAYRNQQYDLAETSYLRALAHKDSYEAFYNLGNAYLMQGKDSTGVAQFMNADSLGTTNQKKRAMTYHNLGNVWYAQGSSLLKSNQDATGMFQKAVDYYKSSLRCNPDDDETRYNLAKAQFQLKKSQQNKKQNQQNQQQNQQNEEKQKQEKQKQEEQKQQQQQPKEEKSQMSDQTSEQLLNSARQDEKRVRDKMKPKAGQRHLEKDW